MADQSPAAPPPAAAAEDGPNAGIVYLAVNQAMPGLIKLGFTGTGEFEEHFRQLYSPGVPFPFECIHAVRVGDVRFVTERLRLAFADQRPNPNREFFTVSPERLRAVLELVQGVEQTLAEDAVASDQTDRLALDRARRRRGRYRFDIVGIPIGAVLRSTFDDNVTCRVLNDRDVEYQGKAISLSEAALAVAQEHRRNWRRIQGPAYWTFDGVPLDELLEKVRDLIDDQAETGRSGD